MSAARFSSMSCRRRSETDVNKDSQRTCDQLLDCQDVHDVNKEIYGLTVNRRAINLKHSLSERCLIGNSAHKP